MSEKKPRIPREITWFLTFWISVIALLALAAFLIDISHQQTY